MVSYRAVFFISFPELSLIDWFKFGLYSAIFGLGLLEKERLKFVFRGRDDAIILPTSV
jgi:hypothetical protein